VQSYEGSCELLLFFEGHLISNENSYEKSNQQEMAALDQLKFLVDQIFHKLFHLLIDGLRPDLSWLALYFHLNFGAFTSR